MHDAFPNLRLAVQHFARHEANIRLPAYVCIDNTNTQLVGNPNLNAPAPPPPPPAHTSSGADCNFPDGLPISGVGVGGRCDPH